jgi:uncharacterized membrane protein
VARADDADSVVLRLGERAANEAERRPVEAVLGGWIVITLTWTFLRRLILETQLHVLHAVLLIAPRHAEHGG